MALIPTGTSSTTIADSNLTAPAAGGRIDGIPVNGACTSCGGTFEDQYLKWIIGVGGLIILGAVLRDSRKILFPGGDNSAAAT
jgi:hypothetical protein